MKKIIEVMMELQLYATITNINTSTGYTSDDGQSTSSFTPGHELSIGMKTYYNTELLENARPDLVYEQFARKQALPANSGRTVEWRKWDELPQASVLTEGVIPSGTKLGQTVLTDSIAQYGMYVPISDILDLHHVDNVLLGATEELGASAGETIDTLVRNDILAGTNVLYADTVSGGSVTPVNSRAGLRNDNNRLTSDVVNQAYTILRKMKAPLISGKYVAVIHPSVAYDLRQDAGWLDAHKYASPEEIYNGEIGELHNVRFVVSTNAPVLRSGVDNLSMSAYITNDSGSTASYGTASGYKATVVLAATAAEGWVGKNVTVVASGTVYTGKVKGASANTLWFEADVHGGSGAVVAMEGGNADGGAIYPCIILGKDAYGTIDVSGGNMAMIVKSAEQAGGPLNQFSTAGYKFETNGAKILYQNRILRVEVCSRYSSSEEGNVA